MNNVFISHADEDQYFLNLFAALLEFHFINVWYCRFKIKPGDKFENEIEEAINKSNTLIAIVSKNTLKSNWVKKEILNFQSKKPKARIIPILLESVNLYDLVPGLETYKYIDFSKCMLTGFQELLDIFGKKFLDFPERRKKSDRRFKKDVDRRKSPLVQRMRRGFWIAYSSVSGYSKFDTVILDYSFRYKVIDALEKEARRYDFFDKEGNLCDIKERVLEESTYKVWDNMRDRENIKAVVAIEAVAEEICKLFEVKPKDRRTQLRRKVEIS